MAALWLSRRMATLGTFGTAGNAGAAFAFVRVDPGSEFVLQQQLIPTGSTSGFGQAVAVSCAYAAIASPGNTAVFVFKRVGTTWTQKPESSGSSFRVLDPQSSLMA